jgi:hypothetical protein
MKATRVEVTRIRLTQCLLSALTALIWLAAPAPTPAASGLPFPSFEVQFNVYAKGVPVGEAVLTLTDEGNGRYSMRSDITPTGVVSLFTSQEIHERVYGRFQNGQLQPISYQQQRKGKKARTVEITFDWQKGTALGDKNGERTTISVAPGMVDPLSLYLLAMLDLKQGKTVTEYTIVSDDRLKRYQVRRHGEETVKTAMGDLKTLRFSRQRVDKDEVVSLWFAPRFDYLPVQIAQSKKGSEQARMTLRSVKGITLK